MYFKTKKLAIATILTAVISAPTLAANLDLSGRTNADMKRDITSKPEQIISFSGVKKGQKVLDFLGGGGYYSEILTRVVGPKGEVVLHNNQAYLNYVGKQLTKKSELGYLKNITQLNSEADDLKLGEEQFDIAFLVLGYHDFFHKDTGWDFPPEQTIVQLIESLKPGGKLLVIDHDSVEGTESKHTKDLHRIEDSFVKTDLEKRGFRLIKESNILRNKNDSRIGSVFDPKIRRKTDRFVMLFEKEAH